MILPRVQLKDYLRRGVAEFIGTFALIFVGVGSAIYGDATIVALSHGFVIFVMVTSFAQISGGHFNPAVTLGFLVTRRLPVRMGIFYWVVQLTGATVGALLLKWVLPAQTKGLHLGAPLIAPSLDPAKGVVIEGILTFFLVLVVFATAVDPNGAFDKVAGLAIGLTMALGIMMGAGLTGAALNPARAFGPQLVSGHWANAWIWYIGPGMGAVIAALLYENLYLGHSKPAPDERATLRTNASR